MVRKQVNSVPIFQLSQEKVVFILEETYQTMFNTQTKLIINLTAFEFLTKMKIMYHEHVKSNYILDNFIIRFPIQRLVKDEMEITRFDDLNKIFQHVP
jgi:hypothetical protein